MHFEEGLTFDDVLIIPQYSDIEHRSDVSLATKIFSNYSLELPFVSEDYVLQNNQSVFELLLQFDSKDRVVSEFLRILRVYFQLAVF
jgi:hypothetical protein